MKAVLSRAGRSFLWSLTKINEASPVGRGQWSLLNSLLNRGFVEPATLGGQVRITAKGREALKHTTPTQPERTL